MSSVCVPVFSVEMLKSAEEKADLIEVRADFFSDEGIGKLKGHEAKKPLIVTLRPVWEMGKYEGTEEERMEKLRGLLGIAEYVDVELRGENAKGLCEMVKGAGKKLIVSAHYRDTPELEELREVKGKMGEMGADVCKIICTAEKVGDNEVALELAKEGCVSFCMGGLGVVSRMLSPYYGAPFTFASLEMGKESAPGQVEVDDLEMTFSDFDEGKLGKETKLMFVLGDPVVHSLSPPMQRKAIEENGMDAVYARMHVLPGQLGAFVENLRFSKVLGANVTIPHKSAVMEFLDFIGDDAVAIGAVNTIVNKEGKLYGSNTDAYGALTALQSQGVETEGKKVLLMGAGGAARAVSYILLAEGKVERIVVLDIDGEKAEGLAKDMEKFGKIEGRGLGDEVLKESCKEADIVINATPLGMHPREEMSAVPKELLGEGQVVFDVVYTPKYTKLLKEAREKGCKVVTGDLMLLFQGVKAFELFTGKSATSEKMLKELEKTLGR